MVVYIALFAAAIVVGDHLSWRFGGDLDASPSAPTTTGWRSRAASLAVAYVIAITAGITEEIVFRAYAITRLEELGWRRAAVHRARRGVHRCCTSTRGSSRSSLIGAVTAAFTWLFRWKRSIWPVMVAHALFDGVQLTLAASFAGN